MFELEYKILPPNAEYVMSATVIDIVEKELMDLCSVVRTGGSLVCSPSDDSLIVVFTIFNQLRKLEIHVRFSSTNAKKLAELINEVSSKLKSKGYLITLSISSNILP
ncbi:hypothetical protein SUSAZ_06855 [Sulfolobus acidocaldarius SUSAZ]|nr:hypothetical protein SUSAZ_06855 [Sulfolobus acidocaldarius SUSAZ]